MLVYTSAFSVAEETLKPERKESKEWPDDEDEAAAPATFAETNRIMIARMEYALEPNTTTLVMNCQFKLINISLRFDLGIAGHAR
jgi:hypothetical protein